MKNFPLNKQGTIISEEFNMEKNGTRNEFILKNDNHIELVCVINLKLNTQVIIFSVSIDGVAV